MLGGVGHRPAVAAGEADVGGPAAATAGAPEAAALTAVADAEVAGQVAAREVPAGEVVVTVDGRAVALVVELADSLLRALRDAGETQVAGACEQGECGSCSVVLDGTLVASCLVPAAACAGVAVRTAPGVLGGDLAAALARHGAVQCGFCTPGIVVAAEVAMSAAGAAGRALDQGAAREALAGNLCRCTGYDGILAAVVEVAALRAGDPALAAAAPFPEDDPSVHGAVAVDDDPLSG